MDKDRADDQNMLDYVLDFYERKGTPLSFRPRLFYHTEQPPHKPSTLACVFAQIENQAALQQYVMQTTGRASIHLMLKHFSLTASDAAVDEFIGAVYSKLSAKEEEDLDKKYGLDSLDGDIILFPLYCNQDAADREKTLAHEVWHLIERERRILKVRPLISEGTATCAELTFAGHRPMRKPEDCTSVKNLIYRGAAFIVYEHAKHELKPYQAMLRDDVRRGIEDEFLQRFPVAIQNLTDKMLENDSHRAMMLIELQENNTLLPSDGIVTAESVLQSYRAMGAHKLADELIGQDLRPTIAYTQKIWDKLLQKRA